MTGMQCLVAVVPTGECCCSGGADRAKRYIPFADGPRNCIGQSLAQTTLPITLGALLSHFTFRLADQVMRAGRSPDGTPVHAARWPDGQP